ncbi:YhjD/YihY/BrkB family envelope integrity protein [Actinocorallia sp. B10E7]|uniref:YihY/virulence factor BrkB family protein n=1 Tax=Actinocorallia sp. B10E7 TaxID=3153558 RepID=UPI00325D983C
MTRLTEPVVQRFEALQQKTATRLRSLRTKRPWFDHLVRTVQRYDGENGDQLAAALTFYAFLAFFPMLALGYALLGYVVYFSETFRDYLIQSLDDYLPGLASQLGVEQIAKARVGAGVIALIGLSWAGLGWAANLRESIRVLWGRAPRSAGNFFLLKLRDLAVLGFLGIMLIVSVAATTIAVRMTSFTVEQLGLADSVWAWLSLRVASVAVALLCNTVIFLMVFTRMSGTNAPHKHVGKGALVAAVGFEILKTAAAFLFGYVAGNPIYASFAVLVGVLIWMNLLSRMTFLVVAWTATLGPIERTDTPLNPEPDAA